MGMRPAMRCSFQGCSCRFRCSAQDAAWKLLKNDPVTYAK